MLFEITPDGKRILVAKDCIDPAGVDGDDYVSIPLDHVSACKTQRFMLQFAIPSDAPPAAFVVIPLYASADAGAIRLINDDVPSEPASKSSDSVGRMRGFIYLESPGTAAQLIARRSKQ